MSSQRKQRRGAAAVLAMLYLTLFATLAMAMYAMTTINVQVADNQADAERARGVAESGLRWMQHRFVRMNRPKTTIGEITPTVAANLWPAIRSAIASDLASMLNPSERVATITGTTLTTAPIAVDNEPGRFVITIRPDPTDARLLLVSSRGTYGSATRTVSMAFTIDKKVKYAIVGKVPIQLGRNTIVEGPVAMLTGGKYPPLFTLSDFRGLKTSLTNRIDAFQAFLEQQHAGYDNRINVNNPSEYAAAVKAGFDDYSGDGFVDEYDLFLREFDTDRDGGISRSEFTNNKGKLYDPELFSAIDSLGGPLFDGDPQRAGYKDDRIDNLDGYAKVRGQVAVATSSSDWKSNLSGSGQSIQDQMKGPIVSDGSGSPVQFGATGSEVFDLSPDNFDTSGFKSRTGPENGPTSRNSKVISNAVLRASDANGGTVDERTPLGSTTYQATYRRPVFKNITFRNCRIPAGLNALFENCKFEGNTYVEMATNVTDASGRTTTSASDGMDYSKRMKNGSFNKDTVLTASNSWGYVQGNNLRFNNCTIEGPIAADVRTAYTHFTDSWEFTGATMFDNKADETATIVAPQTNIEMGSFTDPAKAPSTLKGVVVAGNIDIRGSGMVDGSIIVTGDGAGNTTQGWFGASDASTDPGSPMPEGGWGRLNIRYNPYRPLPDGINIAVDILPEVASYQEGA